MSELQDETVASPWRRTDWDRLTAIAAILIGLVAVAVAAYTAFIQRQQVSAQVWPYLLIGSYDNEHAVKVLNKGVGPALVRSVQVTVDGKPQRNWKQVLIALGLPDHGYEISTLSNNVLSPGESLPMIKLIDNDAYVHFRTAFSRVGMEICFCSTLDDCWRYSDAPGGSRTRRQTVTQCPLLPQSDAFTD